MQLTKEKQDLTRLSWSVNRNSLGIGGSFLKAYSELGGTKTYYKPSNFDKTRGIIGHECVNELIVDRLLTILGIPHLPYQLIHADVSVDGRTHEVYLCASEDFKAKSESKTALDAYKELEALPDESALDFCIRMGWEDYIYQMLVVDYLILNRDRHGANIEVLRNSRKKTIRLAPLFDHGNSLFNFAGTDAWADSTALEEYIETLYPSVYDDFLGTAKSVLTPELREKLRHLLTFHFKKHSRYNLPPKRLRMIEKQIQKRAGILLEH